jgi:putative FmdB family regulatory protein
VFEVRQRISEPALTVCETCGGPVRRLIAAAPFILKGEGWYVTDYPSASRKKAMDAEKPSKPADTKPADGKPADGKAADGKAADKPATDGKASAGPSTGASSSSTSSD